MPMYLELNLLLDALAIPSLVSYVLGLRTVCVLGDGLVQFALPLGQTERFYHHTIVLLTHEFSY